MANFRGSWLTYRGSSSLRVRLRSSTSRRWLRACGEFVEQACARKARSEVKLWWAGNRPLVGVELSKLTDIELSILKKAQEEYEGTGTLSRATYQTLLPLLNDNYPIDLGLGIAQRNLEPLYMVQIPTESVSDELFHNSLNVGAEVVEDYYAGHALPPEAAMNQILRYEKAAQKKFDWALQRLLESQERRRKAQAAVSV